MDGGAEERGGSGGGGAGENRREGEKKGSFLQIPQCNQETALKVLQRCKDCFALPGVFVVKQR